MAVAMWERPEPARCAAVAARVITAKGAYSREVDKANG